MIQLRKMHTEELSVFRNYSISDYARDLMHAQSISIEAALAQAAQEFDDLLPGSFLRIIEHGTCAVGVLWYLTEETDGVRHVFINDFIIAPEQRCKGYARAALAALVQEACSCNCTEIRLYVTDDNHAARTLYESCGYQVLRHAEFGVYLHKIIC